jgi:hypothetical protein
MESSEEKSYRLLHIISWNGIYSHVLQYISLLINWMTFGWMKKNCSEVISIYRRFRTPGETQG